MPCLKQFCIFTVNPYFLMGYILLNKSIISIIIFLIEKLLIFLNGEFLRHQWIYCQNHRITGHGAIGIADDAFILRCCIDDAGGISISRIYGSANSLKRRAPKGFCIH